MNHYFYELSLCMPNKQILSENGHLSPSWSAGKYNTVKLQGGKARSVSLTIISGDSRLPCVVGEARQSLVISRSQRWIWEFGEPGYLLVTVCRACANGESAAERENTGHQQKNLVAFSDGYMLSRA